MNGAAKKGSKKWVESMLAAVKADPRFNQALVAHRAAVAAQQAGMCHDVATAIIDALNRDGRAEGWTWCKGTVDGGVAHSWVEYGAWCIDADDLDLRVNPTTARPFAVDDERKVDRRAHRATLKWLDAQAYAAKMKQKKAARA